jgi:hypothetical protein
MKKTHPSIITSLFILACFMTSGAQVPDRFKENLVGYLEVNIEIRNFKNILQNAPLKGVLSENRNSIVLIDLPVPTGGTQQFKVVEAPMMSPELSRTLPDFKSYVAQGIDDPTASARFNITPVGFYGVIKGINGISIIEQIDKTRRDNRYITYYDHDIISVNQNDFCESDEIMDRANVSQLASRANSCFQNGANLRTYEMVVTCTGEFYALNGGDNTSVQAALLARLAQINSVYEPELAISIVIVEYLLNSDAGTDPFTNPLNTSATLFEGESYMNSNASVNFDIGHTFHEITCGGGCGWAGIAGVGVVCTSGRARGYTYLPNDIPTDITVLVHEIGHMFSSYHTNYGCDSENSCERYEPGQGSSIMSTGAGCDGGDFFANRTDYFGIGSLQSMMNFTETGTIPFGDPNCSSGVASGWTDCAAISASGNAMPSADATSISGLMIPHSTPFTLSGTGSDADGVESLTYNWEQYDTDYAGSAGPDDTGASTTAPQFRSFPPSMSSERSCPQLSSVLAGNVTTGTGEILPTVARTLTWRLVVRDNNAGAGGIACDEISLNVSSDGPFQITSQNEISAWFVGSAQTVTWDVANTNMAAYTCATVDILYSSDGGIAFDTTLASNVANDGSHGITAPAVASATGRIKIVCHGGSNIFFDINNVDIAVISDCSAEGGMISNTTAVTALEGDPSLNLSLFAGLPITSIAGVLDAGDSNTNLSVENNGGGTCVFFSNSPKYETMEFYVAANANVTFTRTAQSDYTSMIGLYQTSYDPSDVCDNWLNSNGNFNGSSVNISPNLSETLATGTKYVLLSSAFSSTTPTTGNYNITFSETLFNTNALTPTGYLYTYAIINTDTGNTVAFDVNSDLTDSGIFTAGNYAVHGLSYLAGSSLATYIGDAFTTLQSDIGDSTLCGDLSTNSVAVTIEAVPCLDATWNGSVSSDWANPNNWTPNGEPTACSEIIIPIAVNTPTITGVITITDLNINSGANMLVPSGTTLNVSGDLNMYSVSDSYSGLVVNGTIAITGTTKYHRFTNSQSNDNDLIAPPLSGQTWSSFLTSDSSYNEGLIFNNGVQPLTTYLFGPFEKGTTDDYVLYTDNSTALLVSGKGYRSATNTVNGEALIFTGSILTSAVNTDIVNEATGNFKQWNLIGNPYPAYIDVDLFFNHIGSVSGVTNLSLLDEDTAAIYGYDADDTDITGSNWTITNLVEGPELIAPGQGFFVSSKDPSASLQFTPEMQVVGASDDFIQGRSSNTTDFMKIKATTDSKSYATSIYFHVNGSTGLDIGYDAAIFGGNAPQFALYSHLVQDNEGVPMAIQTLNTDGINAIVIPLGLNANAGEQVVISLGDFNVPANTEVYLEDNTDNSFTLLTTAAYNFVPNTNLNGTGRFFLHFSANVLATEAANFKGINIYTDQTERTIIIEGTFVNKTEAFIYDMLGRKVKQYALDTLVHTNIFNVNALSLGIYFIKLQEGNKQYA